MNYRSINTPLQDPCREIPHAEDQRDQQARQAGNIIYRVASGLGLDNRADAVQESDDLTPLLGGRRPAEDRACCGVMSPVRRTFCLIVTFDLILTFILWVIYTQVTGIRPLTKAFTQQVVHYNFSTSLFDTTLCAAWRFAPLLLAYALYRISNPWVVAVTTVGTCVFLLVKVFLFDFTKSHDNVITYFLLIVSFTISWIEVWFLDFKVFPQERKAREREAFYRRIAAGENANQSQNRSHSHRHHHPGDLFRTPVDSREGSDDEGSHLDFYQSVPGSQGHSRQPSHLGLPLSSEADEYIKQAHEAWEKTWEILHTEEGWRLETGKDLENGRVHSHHFKGLGKIFKLEGMIHCAPRMLFESLVRNAASAPEWNPTVLEARIVQVVTDNIDILYNVAAEAAGGLVSRRDFVSIRHWKERSGVLMSAGCAVAHPDCPPNKKNVRGENRTGGWAFISVPENPNQCKFIWILSTDLKGWLPQYAIDQALGGFLMDYFKHLKLHVEPR